MCELTEPFANVAKAWLSVLVKRLLFPNGDIGLVFFRELGPKAKDPLIFDRFRLLRRRQKNTSSASTTRMPKPTPTNVPATFPLCCQKLSPAYLLLGLISDAENPEDAVGFEALVVELGVDDSELEVVVSVLEELRVLGSKEDNDVIEEEVDDALEESVVLEGDPGLELCVEDEDVVVSDGDIVDEEEVFREAAELDVSLDVEEEDDDDDEVDDWLEKLACCVPLGCPI